MKTITNIKKAIKIRLIRAIGLVLRGSVSSDVAYLKLLFKHYMGKALNLDNPQTFNEKIQWLKLYDRRPEYTMMVDKYAVREYVSKKIGSQYLVPLVGGPWKCFDEINFKALPNQFVLKCTHDSGGLAICRDKSKIDTHKVRRKINKCLKRNFFYFGREWPYKNVLPRIIAEKYMEDSQSKKGLIDYKFFCFAGEPKFLYVSQGLENHKTAEISFLTLDWEFEPFKRADYKSFATLPPKPSSLSEMLIISKILSKGIPFIRVDLYEINGNVYFSELTFSPCAGYIPFDPSQYDKIIGEILILPADIE